MKEDLKKFMDIMWNNKFIFLIGLLCVCIPPLLFTGNLLFNSGIDFTEEGIGQIGDIIGGTTAPFIGLFGAVLIYISFLQQVKANQTLEKETKMANSFKVYDTIVDLIEFTHSQYDTLLKEDLKDERNTLCTLLKAENPDREILKKYRCVLELVSQCFNCIRKFEVPKNNGNIDTESDLYFYKNQLRALLLPHYYMYYKKLIRGSTDFLKISTVDKDMHFQYLETEFEINKNIDAYNDDSLSLLKDKGKMSIYFIASAIKNIVDCKENRGHEDYYHFTRFNNS